jgi:amidohydrolase
MSVGAAIALQKANPSFEGTISVLGTPAEEGGGGKITLTEKGFFHDVDVAMMIHPSSKNKMIRFMLAVVELKFVFHGKAAHAAAYPHEGINALDAVLLTFNNINALRQQLKSDVRIHGIISEGGVAPNIIPERASARFYVRSINPQYFESLVEKVKKCAHGAAVATGTRLEIETGEMVYSPFKPNYTLGQIFKDNLSLLSLEEDKIKEDEGMGSSDIGNVSQEVPTIHADIKICGTEAVIHSPEFAQAAVSEQGMNALINGAKLMALSAADLIIQPKKMEAVIKEFGSL